MNKSLMLNKLKNYYSFDKDKEFADFLGITSQRLNNWKSRNTFDPDVIYTKCVDINPEWLLTGKGEMLKNEKFEENLPQKKYPKINQRIKEIIENLCNNNTLEFAQKIGYKISIVEQLIADEPRTPSENILKAIYDNFPEINKNWMLTGTGNMIQTQIAAELPEQYNTGTDYDKVLMLRLLECQDEKFILIEQKKHLEEKIRELEKNK